MGCVPEKRVSGYDKFIQEQQQINKRQTQNNLSKNSKNFPRNSKDINTNKQVSRKGERNSLIKTPVTPTKDRKNSIIYKRNAQSYQKNRNSLNQQQTIMPAKPPIIQRNTAIRKTGNVILLPPKPHVITKIQTPSESAKSSILSQLQQHPSLFFVKFQSKIMKDHEQSSYNNNKLTSFPPHNMQTLKQEPKESEYDSIQ